VVDAGGDVTIRLPEDSVALDATVTDDGLPSNSLTYTWRVSSGPADVTFADASSVDTTVRFVSAGNYELQLTASDSELAATDNVQITVEAAPVATSLSIAPASVSLSPGAVQIFHARATDQYGDPIARDIVWTTTGGAIDQDGNFTAGSKAGDFLVTAVAGSISDTATVTIIASSPKADPGGPYTGMQGAAIELDGSGSSDPNDDIVVYKWDLDNDGVFDDATGLKPTYAAVRAGVFTIALQVTDAVGASDSSTTIVLTGSDPGGDPLTCAIVSPPASGKLSGIEPEVAYIPDPDFNGTDSFAYIVSDGELDSQVAIVSIAVSAVNDPPAAYDQSSTTVAGEAVLLDLEYHDIDGPGPYGWQITTATESGSLSPISPDGKVLYTPDPGFTGTDQFRWRVNDGLDDSAIATVTVTVDAESPTGIYFPPAGESLSNQSLKSPGEVGLSDAVVADLTSVITSGRWALWRDGYLVHVEGDFNANDEVKSLRKIIHAATVGVAIQRHLVPSLDQKVSAWNPELIKRYQRGRDLGSCDDPDICIR
jgi:PKD repeat protein